MFPFYTSWKQKHWEEYVLKTYFITYIKFYCTELTVDLDVSSENQYLIFLEVFYVNVSPSFYKKWTQCSIYNSFFNSLFILPMSTNVLDDSCIDYEK